VAVLVSGCPEEPQESCVAVAAGDAETGCDALAEVREAAVGPATHGNGGFQGEAEGSGSRLGDDDVRRRRVLGDRVGCAEAGVRVVGRPEREDQLRLPPDRGFFVDGGLPHDPADEVVPLVQTPVGRLHRRVLAKTLTQAGRLPDVQDLIAFSKEEIDTGLVGGVGRGSTQYVGCLVSRHRPDNRG
jgi:hypothetical protein